MLILTGIAPPLLFAHPPALPGGGALEPMTQRRYTEAEKAEALAVLEANAGNITGTARVVGIPAATLRLWRGHSAPAPAETCEEKKQDLATALEEIARKLIGAIPEKIGEASLQQVSTSLGIAIDKMQLLRGQPTSRTATMTEDWQAKTDAELDAIIAEADTIARGLDPAAGGSA